MNSLMFATPFSNVTVVPGPGIMQPALSFLVTPMVSASSGFLQASSGKDSELPPTAFGRQLISTSDVVLHLSVWAPEAARDKRLKKRAAFRELETTPIAICGKDRDLCRSSRFDLSPLFPPHSLLSLSLPSNRLKSELTPW